MARIRVNRNSFAAGVLSKKAQANSSAEMYNYGLDICRNMVIDPLGGAYKRQGTNYVTTIDSDKCRIIEFKFAPGKSCIVMFSESDITFFQYTVDKIKISKVEYEQGDELKYEDFVKMPYFILENKLYFYIARREAGPKPGFWSIEQEVPVTSTDPDFKFTVINGIRFIPGPKYPMVPTRLLVVKWDKENDKYVLKLKTEEGIEDISSFSEKDVGRKISFKLENPPTSDNAGVYWPEVVINTVENGVITSATLTPASSDIKTDREDEFNVREWLISAFDGSDEYGGKLGNPDAMTLFQGRMYVGKDTYVFASKVDTSPLCFALGGNDEDGFVQRITSGNMGKILWMHPIEKLIVGTADGIYLIGNSAKYAEPITISTFVANKIGTMGSNNLQAINAQDNIVFVGPDNKSVYELTITQEGSYVISRINRLSEDLVKSTIIDHTWQQSPRKIYWCVTNDGALVGCTYDREGSIRAWHDHVLGGRNTYVLQCETTADEGFDVLWLLVKREILGKLIISLEYMPPPFDPVSEDIFKQMYTDSAVTISNKYQIKNIINSGVYYANIEYGEEEFGALENYIDTHRGDLIIVMNEDFGTIYDNPKLNYFSFRNNGFLIDAYDSRFIIAEEHNELISNSYMMVKTVLQASEIKNESSEFITDAVFVKFATTYNIGALFGKFNDAIILFKDTGYKDLDSKVFCPGDMVGSGFFLKDRDGNKVSIKLEGNLNEKNILYFGTMRKPVISETNDPLVEFGENIFNEDVDDDNRKYRTCRMAEIKGLDTMEVILT
jgi:hypothetical protein